MDDLGAEHRTEALVESVTRLDRDRLGKPAGGDRETDEESDLAEQHQAIAIRALDEKDLCPPFTPSRVDWARPPRRRRAREVGARQPRRT